MPVLHPPHLPLPYDPAEWAPPPHCSAGAGWRETAYVAIGFARVTLTVHESWSGHASAPSMTARLETPMGDGRLTAQEAAALLVRPYQPSGFIAPRWTTPGAWLREHVQHLPSPAARALAVQLGDALGDTGIRACCGDAMRADGYDPVLRVRPDASPESTAPNATPDATSDAAGVAARPASADLSWWRALGGLPYSDAQLGLIAGASDQYDDSDVILGLLATIAARDEQIAATQRDAAQEARARRDQEHRTMRATDALHRLVRVIAVASGDAAAARLMRAEAESPAYSLLLREDGERLVQTMAAHLTEARAHAAALARDAARYRAIRAARVPLNPPRAADPLVTDAAFDAYVDGRFGVAAPSLPPSQISAT